MAGLLRAGWVVALFLASFAQAAETPLAAYDRVEIAPTKTSIYIGSVSMTMPPFVRKQGAFTSTYTAKVFPYFFYNEKGRLSIAISDATLRQLEAGQPVEFEGEGVSSDGETRRIAGRAVPADAKSGKIKVRVFVSKKIQLIFNTTYRFPDLR
jgi:hypothetical protein